MERSIYRITLDLHDRRPLVTLRMTSGDTARRIYVSFADGTVPYVLTPDISARMCAVKPSGLQIFNTMTVEDGTAYYDVTAATLAESGTVECQVRLYDAENRLMSSPRFMLEVSESLLDEQSVESTDEYTALTEALGEVSGAVSACESAAAKAGEVIAAAQDAADEANDAAVAATLSKEAADTAAAYADSAGNNATAAAAVANNAAGTAHNAAVLASDNAALASAAAARAEAAAENIEETVTDIYDEISASKETFMSAAGYAVYRRKMFMPLTNEVTADLKLTPSDLMLGNTKGLVMFTYNAGTKYTGTFTVRTGNAGSQYEYRDIPLGKLTQIVFPDTYAPTFAYKASESFASGAVDMTVVYPKDITSRVLASEAAVGELRQKAEANDTLLIQSLVVGLGVKDALKEYAEANGENESLTDICERFFTAAAKTAGGTYTSEFYKYDSSNTTLGTKLDANSGLTCTPSTMTEAGTDDYAALPLFACFDVNYTIDSTSLEPVIHAIKDVYGDFSSAPADSFVGVMQMTGWVRRTSAETAKKVEYRAAEETGFKPLPEAVRVDGTVRSFVIHAKYAAGYNSAGKLSSVSGVQPATCRPGSAGSTSVSHNGQIALWREWGNQYCGSGLCDIAFIQLMLEIKYAVLGSVQVMSGCRSYSSVYQAAVGETGVTRVLLTAAQAAFFVVGSCVSLGSTNYREKATAYDVCDITKIASIEDVTVGDVAYKAINLETETTFNTTTDTYIIPQPWRTGSTDDVQGNDGSLYSNTSGKEPCKIQGIELMLGTYEIPADTTLYKDTEKYTVYLNRKASEIASNNSGTNPVTIGTIPKETDTAWKYIAELNWDAGDQEAYMLTKEVGGTSSAGYRAGLYRNGAATTGWREWMAFGDLNFWGAGGFACANLDSSIGSVYWHIAARACGTGGNRGVYTAAV